MIAQLFFSLIIISLLALPAALGRRHWLWLFILWAAAAFFGYELFLFFSNYGNNNFVYQWTTFKDFSFSLNLSDNPLLQAVFWPLAGTVLGLVYLNLVYRNERRKLSLNILILMASAAFILQICANDFIQLMAGSCCFVILSFYMISDMAAKQKLVFYNFLAEMALFTALAIVYGSQNSISLEALPRYVSSGNHRDLVAFLVLLAIFAQSGLFLFQNQMLALQNINFNRIVVLYFVSVPLSSLILFYRLSPLFLSNDAAVSLLKGIIGISALWSLWGMLAADSLKAKCIYFNMLFYSFALAWLGLYPERLSEVIEFLPAILLVDLLLVFVCYAASDEIYVSQMGGLARYIPFSFLMALGGTASFLAAFMPAVTAGEAVAQGFVVLAGIGLASVIHWVYLGSVRADERVVALLRNPPVYYWLPWGGLAAWLIYHSGSYGDGIWYAEIGIFIFLLIVAPLRFFRRLADNETVQEADPLGHLYHLLILMPLRLLGRILWITVDFLVIERSIIGSISHTSTFLINGLKRVQNTVWLNYLLMVMIGLLVLLLNIGVPLR